MGADCQLRMPRLTSAAVRHEDAILLCTSPAPGDVCGSLRNEPDVLELSELAPLDSGRRLPPPIFPLSDLVALSCRGKRMIRASDGRRPTADGSFTTAGPRAGTPHHDRPKCRRTSRPHGDTSARGDPQ
ncbi:hypothetical protein WOLCODRAFT_167504 [Wolfiporia cocos MD-104 SS10]|uniref:Uncharacterized protein n=1 Tax=Wolfiporia cocos (strain MD-104) TaxID=742152 RepID=A0A2H3J6B1_WOLCO|nr:hypothetical protein WOLCODRAFT_167504 [Wolfiporia cocos MD-104 SS10]